MAQLSGSVERAMTGDLEFSGGGMSGRFLAFEDWNHDPPVRYPVNTVLRHNNHLWWASQEPPQDDEPGVTTNSVWRQMTGAGAAPPAPTLTNYLGTRVDNAFVAGDFDVSGTTAALAIMGIPAGVRHHVAYARPSSQGNFSYVYIYAAGSRNTVNQIGAWTQLATTLDLGGEPHYIIYSAVTYDDSANGFIVEAG